MSWLDITTADRRTVFAPGDPVTGTVAWSLDEAPSEVELRLFWYTSGKGEQDVVVVDTARFDAPGHQDQRAFSLHLPDGPLSFSGTLITLAWALELVVSPGSLATRTELLVTVIGREIRLSALASKEEEVIEKKGPAWLGRILRQKRAEQGGAGDRP
ncbi:MAG TPA: hypothetical protein VF017_15930 [Thermoanaerobaculia bacterium]|nr:hypothetical protein [Thermoanaerobaculia bacterium]